MTYATDPNSVNSFRDETASGKMRGMMFYTFRCRDCKQDKSTADRKSRGYKAGYRCADCHKKMMDKKAVS